MVEILGERTICAQLCQLLYNIVREAIIVVDKKSSHLDKAALPVKGFYRHRNISYSEE